jgi:hypothetical protein
MAPTTDDMFTQNTMHPVVKQWLGMTRGELDGIFRAAQPRAPIDGNTDGTLIFPIAGLSHTLAALGSAFVWQGKVFNTPKEGMLVNKVTPFRLRLVAGKFDPGKSWLDGSEAIIIDYSETSLVARGFRDEIREVYPGVFMGKVWWTQMRVFDFALVQQCGPGASVSSKQEM